MKIYNTKAAKETINIHAQGRNTEAEVRIYYVDRGWDGPTGADICMSLDEARAFLSAFQEALAKAEENAKLPPKQYDEE